MSLPAGAVDDGGSARTAGSRFGWLIPLAIALATALSFAPSLRGDWVAWDDPINFLDNPHYRGLGWPQLRWMATATLMGHWIPVTWLTLGADYAIWKMNPLGYHLTSLLLHAASASVFYLIARRLLGLAVPSVSDGGLRVAAASSALFWSLHPLRVESVAWITERRDLTSGFFFLLAVLAYLKAHAPGGRPAWRWTTVAFAALALASKSVVMGLPLALVIIDAYPLRRFGGDWRAWTSARAWPIWKEKIPFVVLAACSAGIALWVQRTTGYLTPGEAYPLPARVGMAFYNVFFHAAKTFVPLNLAPLYELPVRVNPLDRPFVLSAIAVVAITAAAWLARKRWPFVPAIWAFYLVMLAPVSGIVHTGYHLGADRNTYIPCAGFALLLGGLVCALVRAWRARLIGTPVAAAAVALGVVWIGGLGVATWSHVQIWRDSETLWRYAIEVDPDCAICHHNLGTVLARRSERAQSMYHFQRALALRPDHAQFRANLGLLLVEMGRRPEGMAEIRTALKRQPSDVDARTNLGIALIEEGQYEEAIRELQTALRRKPDHVTTLTALGRALLADGKADRATVAFARAVSIAPEAPIAHLGLARAHLAQGNAEAAREQLRIVRTLDPKLADAAEPEFR
jgi:tetratricopeptide (TPR) repeat protein